MAIPTPESSRSLLDGPEVHRILVALDSSRSSLRALGAAAEMARTLQAEIEGLFIEDEELVRLAALPFSRQVGFTCGGETSVDSDAVERQFRLLARQAQAALARAADAASVPWRFTVRRGLVRETLTRVASDSDIVSLGHHGWSGGLRRHLGSSARGLLAGFHRSVLLLPDEQVATSPLLLVYDGSQGAEQALQLVARLLASRQVDSVVILVSDPTPAADLKARVEGRLSSAQTRLRYVEVKSRDHQVLADAVRAVRPGLCVVSAEGDWVRSDAFRQLLLDTPFAALLVR
ncbi:MAG: universal stress protein [Gammaproteobacteria bacterium]|nr:universal stress protein [Gammaproteobacteria bacterium]